MSENETVDDGCDAEIITSETKSKKLKKKRRLDETEELVTPEEKLSSGKIEERSTGATKSKKRKKSETEESEAVDVVVASTAGKAKSKKISGETKESDDVEPNVTPNGTEKEAEDSGSNAGQWATAKFANNDRQNKFLRLLGAMKKEPGEKKKGLFGSLKESSDHTNFAMGLKEQARLNAQLQQQFDKAMDFKTNKRSGFSA
jgi:hypothetical protein